MYKLYKVLWLQPPWSPACANVFPAALVLIKHNESFDSYNNRYILNLMFHNLFTKAGCSNSRMFQTHD